MYFCFVLSFNCLLFLLSCVMCDANFKSFDCYLIVVMIVFDGVVVSLCRCDFFYWGWWFVVDCCCLCWCLRWSSC